MARSSVSLEEALPLVQARMAELRGKGGGREKRPHVLPPITRLRYPKRFLFFDSESTVRGFGQARPEIVEKLHVPRLIRAETWVANESWEYAQQETLDYRGEAAQLCDGFWTHVSELADRRQGRDRSSLVVIGHNIGYDVLATGGAVRLHRLGWKSEAPYEKGPVFIWRFTKNGRTIVLLSSTNFFAVPLKKLGETFNLPKLGTDTQTDDMAELEAYCARDVAIARTAILELVRFLFTNDLGPWADTISSVAFKCWRYRFLRHRVELHTDPAATKLERASYFGGRTEVFLCGVECPLPVFDLDVNSLYPSVMLSLNYPTKLLGIRQGGVAELTAAVEEGSLVIAEVEVEIGRPCLPYRDAEIGKLVFPIGRFRTTLCSPELTIALREGRILDVGSWALYEGQPIFSEYVGTIYGRRVEAKSQGLDAWVQLYKNLLNNLYGKFGQRKEDWEIVGNADPDQVSVTEYVGEHGEVLTERIFGGQRWVLRGSGESYNSFPAIAAFVTSNARAVLWSAMNVAGNLDPEEPFGRAGREFYYCDTDSLFVSKTGYDRLCAAGLVDPLQLGKLKLEKTLTQQAIFFGAKVYSIDGKRRHKGLPESARPAWDDGTEVRTKDGEAARVYDSWPKLGSALRSGRLDGYANRPIVKRVGVTYDKATVWADGWVTPLRLPKADDVRPSPEDTYTVKLRKGP